MGRVSPTAAMTPEQYLDIERAAEFKSEYYKGRMYPMGDAPSAMASGTYRHSKRPTAWAAAWEMLSKGPMRGEWQRYPRLYLARRLIHLP